MADQTNDGFRPGGIDGFASVIPERWCPVCKRWRYLSCFDSEDPAGEEPCNRCIREGKQPVVNKRLHERLANQAPSLSKKIADQAQQIVWLSEQNKSLKQEYATLKKEFKDLRNRLQVEADKEGAACASLKKELAAKEKELSEQRVSALHYRIKAEERYSKNVELLANFCSGKASPPPLYVELDFGGSGE
jgi:regulator of replication initiation timing